MGGQRECVGSGPCARTLCCVCVCVCVCLCACLCVCVCVCVLPDERSCQRENAPDKEGWVHNVEVHQLLAEPASKSGQNAKHTVSQRSRGAPD